MVFERSVLLGAQVWAGVVLFVLGFFNALPCTRIVCLSLFLPLCSAGSSPLVTRSEGKQLMASYLLGVPKTLSQAGQHRCWYHAWGTPVMSVLFCCPSPMGVKDLSQHLVSCARTTAGDG